MGARRLAGAKQVPDECAAVDTGPMALGICTLTYGHTGAHKNAKGSWPR